MVNSEFNEIVLYLFVLSLFDKNFSAIYVLYELGPDIKIGSSSLVINILNKAFVILGKFLSSSKIF